MSAPGRTGAIELWDALGHVGVPEVTDPALWPALLGEVRALYRVGTAVAAQAGIAVPGAAPLPAVPDGEDAQRGRRWICDADPSGVEHTNFVGWTPCPHCRVLDGEPDGEDVPARLDAAADALGALGLEYNARLMRELATAAKVAHPEVRAAVAAALAGPTGGGA